jgi:hypothetical protein
MKVLTFTEIVEEFNNNRKIKWHEDYRVEGWRDGEEPLIIIVVSKLSDDSFYVAYKCSKENCSICNQIILPTHHKIIRGDGFDFIGRGEEIAKGKKTTSVLVDQSVFAKIE